MAPRKPKAKAVEGEKAGSKSVGKKAPQADNVYFTLAVVVIVLLIIVGIIFGYTKDKLNELGDATGGTSDLSEQVAKLTADLTKLEKKTEDLEKLNKENQVLVLDLWEKQRNVPESVDTDGWTMYDDENMQVEIPQTWEIAQPIMGEDEKQTGIYFQPLGQADYAQAISLFEDYMDFSELTLDEKYDIFKELNLIDEFEFSDGVGLYFLNLNDKEEQVPTVLFLTEMHIFRMSFNILDKQATKYLDYRADFEKIAATFLADIEE